MPFILQQKMVEVYLIRLIVVTFNDNLVDYLPNVPRYVPWYLIVLILVFQARPFVGHELGKTRQIGVNRSIKRSRAFT